MWKENFSQIIYNPHLTDANHSCVAIRDYSQRLAKCLQWVSVQESSNLHCETLTKYATPKSSIFWDFDADRMDLLPKCLWSKCPN